MERLIKVRQGDGDNAVFKALREARGPGDTVQVLGDFIMPVDGAWGASDIGGMNVGQGRVDLGKCTLRLSPMLATKWVKGVKQVNRMIPMMQCGRGAEIIGGRIDCNEKAFADPDPAKAWHVQGIRFMEGGPVKVSGTEIIGMRGTYKDRGAKTAAKDVECFAISSQGKIEYGSVIEDVVVGGCADDSYCSGIMLGGTSPIPSTRNGPLGVVRKCSVNLGNNNWFSYSSNVVSSDPCDGQYVEFINCIANSGRGFHNDTGSTMAHLFGCIFTSSWCDISFADGVLGEYRVLVADKCKFNSDVAVVIQNGVAQHFAYIRDSDLLGTRVSSVEGNGHVVVEVESVPTRPLAEGMKRFALFGSAAPTIVLPKP